MIFKTPDGEARYHVQISFESGARPRVFVDGEPVVVVIEEEEKGCRLLHFAVAGRFVSVDITDDRATPAIAEEKS
jgi:hypothetical protein